MTEPVSQPKQPADPKPQSRKPEGANDGLGRRLSGAVGWTVTALAFYLIFTPVALLMRAFGKRPLDLAFDANAKSYWIDRNPTSLDPDSMTRQL